jgi:Icc protein
MTATKLTRRKLLQAAVPLLSAVSLPEETFSKKKPVVRFIVASDGHYGQPDTPFEKNHKEFVRWINQEKFQKGLNFLVLNGDLIHDDPTLLYDFKNSLKPLQVPYHVVRGNHDRVGLDVWKSTWGYETNHSFTWDEYAFLLVDTSNENGKYLCPDFEWVKKELARYSDSKGIFLFMHITPAKWTKHGVDCPELRELFKETHNLKAIFHGHDHDEDSVKVDGGKPFFFDGHFGGSWGTHYRGYRVVEIQDDGSWTSYQFNASAEPKLNSFSGK